jgi:hypothetical protein
VIYFVHIPKTAGTSLRSLFAADFPPEAFAFIYLPPNGISFKELCDLPSARKDKVRIVYGHYPFGADKKFGKPGKYVTFFRETSARLVSNYLHHVRSGLTAKQSIGEYFVRNKPKDMDNYAVRLLSGVDHNVNFMNMTAQHLDIAKQNLTIHFDVFGLFEEMSESINRFRTVLGLMSTPISFKNTRPKHQNTEISADELRIVVAANDLDVRLYEFAKERFHVGYDATRPS